MAPSLTARSVIDVHTGDLLEGSSVTHRWSEDLVFERSSSAVSNALSGLLAHRYGRGGQGCGATARTRTGCSGLSAV
ncbi:MAG TPA: hypothetical protein VIN56_08275 [Candidatus Dormibacteraeota bacterium]